MIRLVFVLFSFLVISNLHANGICRFSNVDIPMKDRDACFDSYAVSYGAYLNLPECGWRCQMKQPWVMTRWTFNGSVNASQHYAYSFAQKKEMQAGGAAFTPEYDPENDTCDQRPSIPLTNLYLGWGQQVCTAGCQYALDESGYSATGASCNIPNGPEPSEQHQNNGDQSCYGSLVGNPINLTTGNKYESDTDVVLLGLSPLELKRHYNSMHLQMYKGVLGYGWTTLYDQRILYTEGADFIYLVREDGKIVKTQVDSINENKYSNEALKGFVVEGSIESGWNVTTKTGSVESYDANGQIQSIEYVSGDVVSVSRSDGVTSITDQYGNSIVLTPGPDNASNSSVQVSVNETPYLRYSMVGNYLTAVEYIDLGVKKVEYKYESTSFRGGLTERINGEGAVTGTWQYDSLGRAISSDVKGGHSPVQLDYLQSSVDVIGEGGRTSSYEFENKMGNYRVTSVVGEETTLCDETTVAKSYYDDGNLKTKTDEAGLVTKYEYDSYGRTTEVLDGLKWDSSNNGVLVPVLGSSQVTYTWLGRTDLLTTKSTYFFNGTDYIIGEKEERQYNDKNKLSKVVLWDFKSDEENPASRVYDIAYDYLDTNGRIVSKMTVDGPSEDNDVFVFGYSSLGFQSYATYPSGDTQYIDSHTFLGAPENIRYPNGSLSALSYDSQSRVLQIVDTYGNNQYIRKYERDSEGRIKKYIDSDNETWLYSYNDAGEVIQEILPDGTEIKYIRDSAGNVVSNQIIGPDTATEFELASNYDEQGRLISLNNQGLGYHTSLAYDSRDLLSSIYYEEQHDENYTRNLRGLVDTVTKGSVNIASYSHDERSNVHSVTDALNQVTQYMNGEFNQVETIISPDTGVTSLTYTSTGDIASKVTETNSLTYMYDAYSRLSSVTSGDSSISYQYQSGSEDRSGLARLSSVSREEVGLAIEYDDLGRIKTYSSLIGQNQYAQEKEYTSEGKLTRHIYPSGIEVSMQYVDGKLTSMVVFSAMGEVLDTISEIETIATGWVVGYRHNVDLEVREPVDKIYRASGVDIVIDGVPFLIYEYQYNTDGLLISKQDMLSPNESESFSYDNFGRLEYASIANGTYEYSYDSNGNVTSSSVLKPESSINQVLYEYSPSNPNRLMTRADSEDTISLSYDMRGRSVSKGDLQLSYDDFGRLSGVSGNAGDYTYVRDGLERRVAKIEQVDLTWWDEFLLSIGVTPSKILESVNLHYVYDDESRVVAIANGHDGSILEEYVYLNDRLVSIVKHDDSAIDVFAVYADHTGKPLKVFDSTNTVSWSADYTPYGDASISSSQDFYFQHRFAGQWYDQESGLFYNYFRDYDPSLGRYLQSDPVGLTGGLNTYTYVGGNPINYNDPNGQSAVVVVGGWISTDTAIPDPTDLAWPKWIGYGALFGGAALVDWLIYNNEDSSQNEKRPKNCPSGTLDIDKAKKKHGWDKDKLHGIKDAAHSGMGTGKSWTGVAPDGTVGINEDGEWSPQGHWEELQ